MKTQKCQNVKHRPLKRRGIFIFILVSSCFLLLNFAVIKFYLHHYQQEFEDKEMLETLKLCEKVFFTHQNANQLYKLESELKYFNLQIIDYDNKVIFSSGKFKDKTYQIPAADKFPYFIERQKIDENEYFRLIIDRKFLNDKKVYFIFGESAGEIDFIKRMTSLLALIFFVSLILLTFLSVYFVNVILKPLDEVIDNFSKINISTLENKIDIKSSSDTIDRLTLNFNIMMERISESVNALKRFISDFSHEIKNPLAVLKSGLEIVMKKDYIKESERNVLNRISEEVSRLEELTKEMLFLAKADANEIKLNKRHLKLKEICDFLYEIGGILTEDKKIKFSVLCPDKNIDLNIGPEKIKQVFINLLNNSIENTEAGEINIKFIMENNFLKCVFSDTGRGIEQEKLPYIFDRFYKIDKSRSRQKHNVGLGLSIVKKIIELHNGKIYAESSIGKGTKIIFLLPIEEYN